MRWHRARPKPTALRNLGAWSLTGLRDFQLLHDVEYFRRLGTIAIVGVRLRITDYAAAVDDETRRDWELPDIRFLDGLNVRLERSEIDVLQVVGERVDHAKRFPDLVIRVHEQIEFQLLGRRLALRPVEALRRQHGRARCRLAESGHRLR